MEMRRWFAGGLLALAGCAGLCGSMSAEAPDKLPKPTTYVSDFAGVIDPASKQAMEDLAGEVYTKAHATIVVVTVKSLDGMEIDDFSRVLEDKWHVGAKGTDKGVLMVWSIGDHKDRIEVGYGMEGVLNDAKVGDILRSVRPLLQQGQYGAGILNAEQQVAQDIAADAGVTLAPPQPVPPQMYHRQTTRRGSGWVSLVIFLVILFFLIGGGGGRGGWIWFLLGSMMGGGGGGGFGGGGGEGGGGSSGGGDFGGGFGGDSGGGGASSDW